MPCVPSLRVNSNMHVQNVLENIARVDVPRAQTDPKALDAQVQCALPTSINSKVLSRYLSTYDQVEASFLVQGFSSGFSLHYDGPQGVRFSGNHQSALQAITVVDEKIRHEIDLGLVAGPFHDIPFVNFQSSPLGLVPKHDPGKYRLIHDLSFPNSVAAECQKGSRNGCNPSPS